MTSEITATRNPAVSDLTPRVVCGLVGAVFLLAATLKAFQPESLTGALTASFDIPQISAVIGGAVLVALEAAIGLALFFGRFRRTAALAAITLLIAFTIYLLAFHSPEAPSCGCFGASAASPVSSSVTLGVVRNLAMLTSLALVTFRSSVSTFSSNSGERT